MVRAAYDDLEAEALDPGLLVCGRSADVRRRRDIAGWVDGWRPIDGRHVLVPGQLVHVPYRFAQDEPVWRAPQSTGAACGQGLDDALTRAVCEVVERDAFLSAWLLQLTLFRVDLEAGHASAGTELLARTIASCRRYCLRPVLLWYPDPSLPVTTVICMLWDDSGSGPPLTVSAKTALSASGAALGALEEALQLRPWVRRILEADDEHASDAPRSLTERAVLWAQPDMLDAAREFGTSDQIVALAELPRPDGDLIAGVEATLGAVLAVDLTAHLPASAQARG